MAKNKKGKEIQKGAGMILGLSMGLSIGFMFGLIVFDNPMLGSIFGLGIGWALGSAYESRAKKEE